MTDLTQAPSPVLMRVASRPFAVEAAEVSVGTGLTIADMMAVYAPGVSALDVTVHVDDWAIPRDRWHVVRPKPGRVVTISVVPGRGGGVLRTVLTIAVLAAAAYFAAPLAGALFGSVTGTAAVTASGAIAGGAATATTATAFAVSVTQAALGVVGSLLVNALVPPPTPSTGQGEQRYSIGAQNQTRPWGTIPVVLGRHKVVCDQAAQPYTEVVGEDQYLRLLFTAGVGPLELDPATFKLGDTALADYSDYEIEVRQGYASDAPVRLFPGDVKEVIPMTTPMRQSEGWYVEELDQDADELSAEFAFPNGIFRMTDKGNRKPTTAGFECQFALTGTENWFGLGGTGQVVITAETDQELIRRGLRQAVPRGRYKVRARRLFDGDDTNGKTVNTVQWTAVRAILNEDPFTPPVPCSKIALRIKASGQTGQDISQFSCIATSILPDYDAATGIWVARPTRNPASLFRAVMQGPGYSRPRPDSDIDLEALEDWHDFCRLNSLRYDAVLTEGASARDRLAQIASLGRARLSTRDARVSVVVDRQQTVRRGVITPRNSWGFKVKRTLRDHPHGLKIEFDSAADDYAKAERIVLADGYSDDGRDAWGNPSSLPQAEKFERVNLSGQGVTDPDQVFRIGRFMLATAILRPRTYECNLGPEFLTLPRGGLVGVTHYVILQGVGAGGARIKGLSDDRTTVTLDDAVPMEAGNTYALRHRDSGTLCPMVTVAGERFTVTLTDALPSGAKIGDLVAFGLAGQVERDCIVRDVFPSRDLTARVVLLDAAPEIYAADVGTIPGYQSGVDTSRLPTPTGLSLQPRVVFEGGAWVTQLTASWDPMHLDDRRIEGYAAQVRAPSGAWAALPTQGTSFRVAPAAQGPWQVRVWSEGQGRRSALAEASAIVSVDTAGAVSGIRAEGGSWNAPDLVAVWDCTLPADSPLFGGFTVEVRHGATAIATVTGLREGRLVYPFGRHLADAAAAGRQPQRSLTLAVQLLDGTGDPVGAPAVATLTNPAHPVPTGVAPQAAFLQVRVDATSATVEPDFAGWAVWVSDTPGINPAAATPRLFDGRVAVVQPLAAGVPVYVRFAARDAYGYDPATASAETAVTPDAIDTADLADKIIGPSQLIDSLNSRIDLIDAPGTGLLDRIGAIEVAAVPALRDAVGTLDRALDEAQDRLADAVGRAALIADGAARTLRDAGIRVDPADGKVKLWALEQYRGQTDARLSSVEITLDAQAAVLALSASRAYVDNAVATAVIDPTQIPVFQGITAQITDLDLRLDAAEGLITQKASTVDLNAQGARLTTAESAISSLQGTITQKADTVTVTALDTRVTSAEQTLAALPSAATLVQAVSVGQLAQDAADDTADAALRGFLSADKDAQRSFGAVASAREELTAKIVADVSAEAAQRLALAARVDDNAAAIRAESVARADADTAEAAQRLALAARVTTAEGGIAANAAAISTEATARANGDGALAQSIQTLQTTVNGNTASIQTQATTLNGLSAQYTVKVDVNGRVAGFGLASTAVNGTPTSHFAVVADLFSVSRPGSGADTFVFATGTDPATGATTLVFNGVTYVGTLHANQVIAGTFSGDRFAANSIEGNILKAGSVAAGKLTIGRGSNLLPNSDGAGGTSFWSIFNWGGNLSNRQLFHNLGGWTPQGGGMLWSNSGTGAASTDPNDYANWQSASVPCFPGQRFEGSAYLGPHRCKMRVGVFFFDSAGNLLGGSAWAPTFVDPGAGGVIDIKTVNEGHRSWVFATAPSGAVTVRLFVSIVGNGGADVYGMWTRAMLAEATPNQTQPSPWAPGGYTRIDGRTITTGRIQNAGGVNFFDFDAGTYNFQDPTGRVLLSSSDIGAGVASSYASGVSSYSQSELTGLPVNQWFTVLTVGNVNNRGNGAELLARLDASLTQHSFSWRVIKQRTNGAFIREHAGQLRSGIDVFEEPAEEAGQVHNYLLQVYVSPIPDGQHLMFSLKSYLRIRWFR